MPPRPNRGALPAYLRIAEHLTIAIGAGRYAPGDRLPTERAMAESYGVSNMTLRKALAVVTDRGLIARRQGSGNYVTGARGDMGTYALFRLEAVPDGGGLPTAEILSFDRAALPRGSALGPGEGWRIRRLRSLDARPVAIEEIWLDARHGDLRASDLSESLYKTYAERLGLRIARAEDLVGVGQLPDWAPAGAVGATPGATMGLVERRAFDHTGHLAEASWTWFDPAHARYRATVP
jgi:GntR family transcriptional regulator